MLCTPTWDAMHTHMRCRAHPCEMPCTTTWDAMHTYMRYRTHPREMLCTSTCLTSKWVSSHICDIAAGSRGVVIILICLNIILFEYGHVETSGFPFFSTQTHSSHLIGNKRLFWSHLNKPGTRFGLLLIPHPSVQAVSWSFVVLHNKDSWIRASLKYIGGSARKAGATRWRRCFSIGLRCYLMTFLVLQLVEVCW